MSFTVSGRTRIPTGHDRDATITWLTAEERRAARTHRQFTGDPDLVEWFVMQEAFAARFAAEVLAEDILLDLDDPVSVMRAAREAFWRLDDITGDSPEMPEYDVPPGAVV